MWQWSKHCSCLCPLTYKWQTRVTRCGIFSWFPAPLTQTPPNICCTPLSLEIAFCFLFSLLDRQNTTAAEPGTSRRFNCVEAGDLSYENLVEAQDRPSVLSHTVVNDSREACGINCCTALLCLPRDRSREAWGCAEDRNCGRCWLIAATG